MREYQLINEYGSRYGTEFVFESRDEMYEFMEENWPDGDFYGSSVWDQRVFTVGEHPERADT